MINYTPHCAQSPFRLSPAPRSTNPVRLTGKARFDFERTIIEAVPGKDRAVLRAVLEYARGKADCWPCVASLARAAGFSTRTVQRALARLEASGVIRLVLDPSVRSRRRIVISGHPAAGEHDNLTPQPRQNVVVEHDKLTPESVERSSPEHTKPVEFAPTSNGPTESRPTTGRRFKSLANLEDAADDPIVAAELAQRRAARVEAEKVLSKIRQDLKPTHDAPSEAPGSSRNDAPTAAAQSPIPEAATAPRATRDAQGLSYESEAAIVEALRRIGPGSTAGERARAALTIARELDDSHSARFWASVVRDVAAGLVPVRVFMGLARAGAFNPARVVVARVQRARASAGP